MIVQAGGLGQWLRGPVPAAGLTHSLAWLPDHQLWTMVLSVQRIKEENGFVIGIKFKPTNTNSKEKEKKNT